MSRFRIPLSRLDEILFRLHRERDPVAVCVMGPSRKCAPEVTELLHHQVLAYGGGADMPSVDSGLCRVLVGLSEGLSARDHRDYLKRMEGLQVEAGLLLAVDREEISAFWAASQDLEAPGPAALLVPGPGMTQVSLQPLDGSTKGGGREPRQTSTEAAQQGCQAVAGQERERYGRLAGGLAEGNVDEGFRLLEKARRLRVSVVGAGRMGSWLAFRLAQSQVGEEAGLFIADPDVVELSNLDGTLLPSRALGLNKAEAVAATIDAMLPEARPLPINEGLGSQAVVDAVRASDVVFTAVDEDAARAGTAVLASCYHILHIDLCGGTAWDREGRALVGGEVRISVPGSAGCLACMGRYDWGRVGDRLAMDGDEERQRRAQTDWHAQRPGSNVDVLYPLIGEALQAFWNVLKGRQRESIWLHYEKDSEGRPRWHDWTNHRAWGRCPVCSRQAGLGDVTF